MTRTRDWRRHQRARIRRKRAHYDTVRWAVETGDGRLIDIATEHPKRCSCWGCMNPRRRGELTLQEKRAADAVKEIGNSMTTDPNSPWPPERSGYPASSSSWQPNTWYFTVICPRCGRAHTLEQCPQVKAVEYYEDGRTIRRVEYFEGTGSRPPVGTITIGGGFNPGMDESFLQRLLGTDGIDTAAADEGEA